MIELVVFILVVLICVCCSYKSINGEPNFEPQPCITDEEFVALMPEHDPELVLKVRDAMVEFSGWDREEIHPDTRLIEFSDW